MFIDLLRAEVLIRLALALGQRQRAQLHGARGLDLDAAAIEVVAVGDLPVEPHAVRVRRPSALAWKAWSGFRNLAWSLGRAGVPRRCRSRPGAA